MKRRLKLCISAGFFVGVAIGDALRRLAGVAVQPRMVILFYHAVPAHQAASFERQMRQLARRARIVPADWDGDSTTCASATGETGNRRYPVAITFDDAFESALQNAMPILAKYGFASTVFVPSGCLGGAPSWRMETCGDQNERVAGADRICELAGALVTVGSHTVTHPALTSLTPPAMRDELERSMSDLAALIGRDVTLLAFPYGIYDSAVLELCRTSGYLQVFTVEPRIVHPADGCYARGRVETYAGDGPVEFFLKMTGSYRWMPSVSALKRRVWADRR